MWSRDRDDYITDIPTSRVVDTRLYRPSCICFSGYYHKVSYKAENGWQSKRPLVTHQAFNWQLTSLVCEVSQNGFNQLKTLGCAPIIDYSIEPSL